MPVSRLLLISLLAGLICGPALGADVPHYVCLNKTEQRAAVASQRALPLADVAKSLQRRGRRAELVRARLCRRGEGLVYVLTLLARSGKVTRTAVDAASGELINGH